jgi:hypothetical protein
MALFTLLVGAGIALACDCKHLACLMFYGQHFAMA